MVACDFYLSTIWSNNYHICLFVIIICFVDVISENIISKISKTNPKMKNKNQKLK